MITPTVGRVVLFQPAINDAELRHYDAPLAAIVARVNDHDLTLNLLVIGPHGSTYGRQNVLLLQDGEPPVEPDRHFCCWMAYQIGQAAQTDALIRGLTTTLATVITRIAALEEHATAPLKVQPELQKEILAASDARAEKDKP